MKTDKIIRLRLSTYRKFRGSYPGIPGESLEAYFKRFILYYNTYINEKGGQK